KLFEHDAELGAASGASCSQRAARKHDCVSIRSLEWASFLDEAIADSRSHRDVHEERMAATRSESTFANRCRADIGVNLCGSHCGQSLPNRHVSPINGATAGHVAFTIYEFSDTGSDPDQID